MRAIIKKCIAVLILKETVKAKIDKQLKVKKDIEKSNLLK